MNRQTIKQIYLLQIKNNGLIPKSIYSKLSEEEKSILVFSDQTKSYSLNPKYRKQISVVLAGGVFDTLHAGHIFFLENAKSQGDILMVSIAKDEHIKKKGREPSHSQIYRLYLVNSIKYVDLAILGKDNPGDILTLVQPDIIVYGYDQEPFLRPKNIKIIKLKNKLNPGNFKTSKLLRTMKFGEI